MSNDHLEPLHLSPSPSLSPSLSPGAAPSDNHNPNNTEPRLLEIEIEMFQARTLLSPDQITAMVSNYSTSFNVVSISIILPILQSKMLYYQDVTPETSSLCASALIAGMILGQLGGGALGDLVGRRKGIMFVMLIQVLGSVGGSILIDGGDNNDNGDGNDDGMANGNGSWTVFEQLAAWRFLIGIGCGGVYPLAASLSSESQSQTQSQTQSQSQRHTESHAGAQEMTPQQNIHRLKMLAATFSTQGIGFVSVPIVAICTLLICGENRLDFVWRFMVGFGALPGIILMGLRYKSIRQGRGRRNCADVDSSADASLETATATTTMSTNGDGVDTTLRQEETLMPNAQGSGTVLTEDRLEEATQIEIFNSNDPEHVAPIIDTIENDQTLPTTNSNTNTKPDLWTAIKSEDQLLLKLAGTAGTWFLFDIVFYGNTLFQPVVIKTAFGYDNDDNQEDDQDEFASLLKNIRDSLILSTIALPGYFVSIALIGKRMCFKYHQTPRYIQLQGFACMAILYSIISYTWDELTQHHWLLVLLYGGTFFFSNYGPNTTTFMMPSITFSPECRSTLNGIAAASGKAGALVGSLMFDPISNKYGDAVVMFLCALTSIFAGVITALCCRPPRSIG